MNKIDAINAYCWHGKSLLCLDQLPICEIRHDDNGTWVMGKGSFRWIRTDERAIDVLWSRMIARSDWPDVARRIDVSVHGDTVSDVIRRNVNRQDARTFSVLGCRLGTANATKAELESALGIADSTPSEDDKVQYSWVFQTPRGPAEVRDYWWNRPDEHSIAGSPRSVRWLCGYLRRLGISVSGTI